MRHSRFPALLMLIGVCLLAQRPVVRLYPVDDTARDPAFRAYIEKLRSAVEARDTDALRKLVHKEVVVGPDRDDKGWDKFVARWRPDDRNSELWTALADLLSLGFIREHPRLFLSPYLVWRFPPDLNMETHLVVTRDKAELREAPSLTAPAVATLSFDIVRRAGDLEGTEGLVQWAYVRTLDGQTGYVNTRDVMSPLIPRAQFGIRGGRWFLTALEAEDQ